MKFKKGQGGGRGVDGSDFIAMYTLRFWCISILYKYVTAVENCIIIEAGLNKFTFFEC